MDMVTLGSGGGEFRMPRRSSIQYLIPAELAIRDAILAVEQAGCDERLTDIVVRLTELNDRLADWAESTGNVIPEGERYAS